MLMNKSAILILIFCTALAPLRAQYHPFQDPSAPIESRIDNVLSLMTLDEKIAVLGTKGIRVPRLEIKGTGIGEAISGVVLGGGSDEMVAGFMSDPQSAMKAMETFGFDPADMDMSAMTGKPVATTQFPEGVGIARTWDPALVREAGAVIGSEARYIHENGKTPRAALILLTPNADLARDPRWGRTQESYGEDPFFNGTIAVALIKGLQGDDPKYWQAASLLKHFLANSNERGRYGSSSDFDVRLFREYYSVPFRMGFVEGGARSYMTSYNAWNKVPMTSNPVIRNITMKEWGVDGVICTDAGAFGFQVSKHKFYATRELAAAATIKAGITLFLDGYRKDVKAALADKLLTEADIDNVVRAKFPYGDPARASGSCRDGAVQQPEGRARPCEFGRAQRDRKAGLAGIDGAAQERKRLPSAGQECDQIDRGDRAARQSRRPGGLQWIAALCGLAIGRNHKSGWFRRGGELRGGQHK